MVLGSAYRASLKRRRWGMSRSALLNRGFSAIDSNWQLLLALRLLAQRPSYGMTLVDIDIADMHEAFAAQMLEYASFI